jgi:hypothetical protein
MKRLLLALLLLTPAAHAGLAVMDFNVLTGGTTNPMIGPYFEDGIRLDALWSDNSNSPFVVQGAAKQYTAAGTGVVRHRISAQSGRPFSLISLRMQGMVLAGNITYTATLPNATTVTQVFNSSPTGGTLRVFPATFENIVSVEWTSNNATVTHTLVDDITVRLPVQVTAAPALTLTEATGTAQVGVQFSEALESPVGLTWQAVAGTASHPADYSFAGGVTTGTVTVPAGASEWMLPLTVAADTTAESLETFTLIFNTTTQNAYMEGNPATTVRIGNDDGVTNFAGWMSGHGLSGNDALAGADPNGDGVKNAEAWLFRLNPAGPYPAAWNDRRPAVHIDSATLRPGLRFTVPTPLPTDVRLIFEENAALSPSWSEQARRTGFGTGSLWTGTGSTRATEVNNGSTSRTVTCGASLTTRQRPRAFLRMKYEIVTGGGNS